MPGYLSAHIECLCGHLADLAHCTKREAIDRLNPLLAETVETLEGFQTRAYRLEDDA